MSSEGKAQKRYHAREIREEGTKEQSPKIEAWIENLRGRCRL